MERISDAPPVEVRFYRRDGSVFLDTHYLIKGVAGAIFWKLAREHALYGRIELRRPLRLREMVDHVYKAAPVPLGRLEAFAGNGRLRGPVSVV